MVGKGKVLSIVLMPFYGIGWVIGLVGYGLACVVSSLVIGFIDAYGAAESFMERWVEQGGEG